MGNVERWFGQRVRVAMAASNIRPTDMANRLGVSRQFICYMMNGKRLPSSANLVEFAEICGVSIDWLMQQSELDFMTRAKK